MAAEFKYSVTTTTRTVTTQEWEVTADHALDFDDIEELVHRREVAGARADPISDDDDDDPRIEVTEVIDEQTGRELEAREEPFDDYGLKGDPDPQEE